MTAPILSLPTLYLDVPGTPVPQGSKIRNRWAGVRESNAAALDPWRGTITAHAQRACTQQGWTRAAGPVTVHATFRLPRPAGHYGTGRNANTLRPAAPVVPATKPDLDKLVRAVLDAITAAGTVWADDARVVEITAAKVYGTPGATIRVEAW